MTTKKEQTTHIFHMPDRTHVFKTSDADALDFIRERTRLGSRLVSSYYRNGEYIYELR